MERLPVHGQAGLADYRIILPRQRLRPLRLSRQPPPPDRHEHRQSPLAQ